MASSVPTTIKVVRRSARRRSYFLACDKAFGQGLEQYKELSDVFEELGTDNPVGHVVKRSRSDIRQAALVGHRQEPQQPRTKEIRSALRRQQEIQCIASGGVSTTMRS